MSHNLLTGAVLAAAMAGVAIAAPAPRYEGAEIAGVQSATITPEAAIQTAEAQGHGRAVSFGLEKTATVDAYEVTIAAAGGTLRVVQVDPHTGVVLGTAAAAADALAADGLPAGAVGSASQSPVALAQAVRTVEQAAHAPALEAGYVLRGGRSLIEVDVVQGSATRTVTVDARDGRTVQAAAEPTEQDATADAD